MYICKILLKCWLRHDKITLGSTIDGRRFALFGGTVTLRLHRNPKGNLGKEGVCYVDYRKSDSGTSIMWYVRASVLDIRSDFIMERHRNSRPAPLK